MTTIHNTVSEFSKYAAQQFLQTAVFIDDRIYGRKDGAIPGPKQISTPKYRPRALKSADQEVAPGDKSEIAEESDYEEYSPHDIATSFAKQQIICSLYQPQRSAKFSRTSDVFTLCLAADIVIVDWDLYGDQGKKAIELVNGLIQQAVDDVPEQLRLILVYTQELNLFAIAGQINDSFGDEISLSAEEGGLAFRTLNSNSRISILGKTGRKRSAEYENHEVQEKDLADFAVKEFAKLASGLLQATTLLGLSEIKKNSRKILSKFNSSLDSAFLTHRAMSLGSEDASSHIIPLLVSEIESVLEDVLPFPLITEQLITDWCMNVWEPGSPANELLKGKSPTDIRNIATAFCLEGEKARGKHNQFPKFSGNLNIRRISKLLSPSEDDVSNHGFSQLMSSRTFYGNAPKTLRLGSVVHDEEDNKYLLCIQPVCDSVRLDHSRVFVFVELSKTNSDCGNQASHVIVKENGEVIELYYQPKSFNCYIAEFSPGSGSKQVQISKSEAYFKDIEEKKYIWLDQLKTSHAQRAVESYARELSRVGLTESEWLRLLNKK